MGVPSEAGAKPKSEGQFVMIDVEDALFKFVREIFLVQKDPWIIEVSVEFVLQLPHTPNCIIQIRIARQHQQRGVGSLGTVHRWRWDTPFVDNVFSMLGDRRGRRMRLRTRQLRGNL